MVRSRDRLAFERALPRIERHARVYFRPVRCPHRKADYVAEALALSWAWWVRLRQRGKRPERFVGALASYAARAAFTGRRVCGHERARDVLSPVAQRRHGFTATTLPGAGLLATPLSDALQDNTRTPPDEQVCFRLDFPAWRRTHGARDRRILDALMLGEGTLRVAGRFGVSPARVSQLRRAFKDGWDRFTDDSSGEA